MSGGAFSPHGPEVEANHAVQNALRGLVIADEKCKAADYGSEVMASLTEARRSLEYVLRLIEGRA